MDKNKPTTMKDLKKNDWVSISSKYHFDNEDVCLFDIAKIETVSSKKKGSCIVHVDMPFCTDQNETVPCQAGPYTLKLSDWDSNPLPQKELAWRLLRAKPQGT